MRLGSDIIDSVLIWHDNNKQLLGCDKESFFVYDDENNYADRTSSARLLRIVTGAHSDEICCI